MKKAAIIPQQRGAASGGQVLGGSGAGSKSRVPGQVPGQVPNHGFREGSGASSESWVPGSSGGLQGRF